jgi:hypothetical protein
VHTIEYSRGEGASSQWEGLAVSWLSQAIGVSIANCCFTADMKILPISHFDIILGMDWLESFCPMQVHWKHKWMPIPYQGATTLLQGITPTVPEEVLVHICHIQQVEDPVDTSMSPEVAVILDQFAMVLSLTELPPKRSCDHIIPLVPGAKPIHIRQYRYPPALKDEIEKQVRKNVG